MSKKAETAPATPLSKIAADIEAAHQAVQQAFRSSVEHAERVGKLLIEAKDQVGHGRWEMWLKANVSFSSRTASNYMRLARALANERNRQFIADLGMAAALKVLAERASWREIPTRVTAITKPGLSIDATPTSIQFVGGGIRIGSPQLEPNRAGASAIERQVATQFGRDMPTEGRETTGCAELVRVDHSALFARNAEAQEIFRLLTDLCTLSQSMTPDECARHLERTDLDSGQLESLLAWLADSVVALDNRRAKHDSP